MIPHKYYAMITVYKKKTGFALEPGVLRAVSVRIPPEPIRKIPKWNEPGLSLKSTEQALPDRFIA